MRRETGTTPPSLPSSLFPRQEGTEAGEDEEEEEGGEKHAKCDLLRGVIIYELRALFVVVWTLCSPLNSPPSHPHF